MSFRMNAIDGNGPVVEPTNFEMGIAGRHGVGLTRFAGADTPLVGLKSAMVLFSTDLVKQSEIPSPFSFNT